MTSADPCTFSASSQMRLPLSRHFAQVSPGITRFFLSIHLPHLSSVIPCSYWASAWFAVLPSRKTLYVISVRQTRDLPVVSLFPHPASFRFHLTMDTLAFGYILPTAGRIRDFHPLETCAAGRTNRKTVHLNYCPNEPFFPNKYSSYSADSVASTFSSLSVSVLSAVVVKRLSKVTFAHTFSSTIHSCSSFQPSNTSLYSSFCL